ncbi:hypothetical protein L195_g051420 [Trifolium pratense]|uniref:Uncharacterized protein n=2 Tax=Trifolium pratense TaxID=57577 RepID=A0ACB0LHH0_TRIPR|nr:hypothetical protein L195_g051420 [Trifolium pratense]CAJ2668856.1 unnamed protein product [Trifolium pratense]
MKTLMRRAALLLRSNSFSFSTNGKNFRSDVIGEGGKVAANLKEEMNGVEMGKARFLMKGLNDLENDGMSAYKFYQNCRQMEPIN